MNTTTCPTAEERKTLTDLLNLFQEAKGGSPALADVRRLIVAETDRFLSVLASNGIDTDALLDEIEGE